MGISKDTKLSIVIEAEADDDGFVNLNTNVKELEKSLNGLEGAAPKTASAFSTFKSAMKAVGDVVQPFNQGLELGKKLLGFAEDGLDAYAKTSREAAKEVKALTDEFKHYRDTVLESVGKLSVALLKPAYSFEEIRKKLVEIGGTPAFKVLYGKAISGDLDRGDIENYIGGKLTDDQIAGLKRLGITFVQVKDPISGVKDALGGFQSALKQGVDYWNTDGTTFVDSFTDGMKKTAEEIKKANIESARYRAELAALQTLHSASIDMESYGPPNRTPGPIGSAAVEQHGEFDPRLSLFGQGLAGIGAANATRNKQQTFLAQTFGEIEDFNAYATAFGTLTDATQSAMGAWISGSTSLGAAIKKGLGDALAGLASSMSIEALKHGAYALGSLAFQDYSGAAKHAAAAAAFGAGAVAAAAAAKKLGSSASTAGATGGGSAGGSASGGGASAAPVVQTERTIVVVYDPNSDDNPRTQRQKFQQAADRANGASGVANK